MTTVAIPAATEQISYTDLYARWERGNWRATEIDLTRDRVDWHERMTPEQRRGALWLYTLFFHGEDAVADGLGPYVDAAPLEEHKQFLTTQQVDESRHTVFFKRFMHEVVGLGDGTTGSALRATAPELTWGHKKVFGRLDEVARQLRERPHDRALLAGAVTLYHVMIEGGLAQSGQHMIERSLEQLDLLPGFREGMHNIAMDEQRHIAFGVRLLAELYAQDPGPVGDAIVGEFRRTLGHATCVAAIPGWDPSYTESFGFMLEDLYEEGARAQEARLRAIGLRLEEIPRFPLPVDLPPRERGERGIRMMKAGYLGPGPATPDPACTAILFDQMARTAAPGVVRDGTTIAWDFTDAPAWHLVLGASDGRARAVAGPAPRADLTLRCALLDWVDVTAERADPLRLMLRRRLRPSGDLRLLARLPRLFGD